MNGYYGENFGRPRVGTEIKNEFAYSDFLAADRNPVPNAVKLKGNYQPERQIVHYEYYYDPAYVPLEKKYIWEKCWQIACREEDIPTVGDRINYDVADMSYMVVRVSENEIKAYYNTCPHRGRTLCDERGSGVHIKCPFHAWTWSLDGSIKWIPSDHDFPSRQTHDYSLSEVKVELWGGNVFINPDNNACSLHDSLGILVNHFKDFPHADRYTVIHLRKKMRANWKVVQEAFQESYHVVETHWDALPFFSDTNTEYDVWKNEAARISRLITPLGKSSFLNESVTCKQAADQAVRTFFGQDPDPVRGLDPLDARYYLADLKRRELERSTGGDYSKHSDTVLIDFIKYFMFPNYHPWMGEFLPLMYRFLPLGTNPDESVMEVRFLAPKPENGEVPTTCPVTEVDFDEPCEGRSELGFLGHIVDQDLCNIPYIQKGIKAGKGGKKSPVLGSQQEKQITYFYEVYKQLLRLE